MRGCAQLSMSFILIAWVHSFTRKTLPRFECWRSWASTPYGGVRSWASNQSSSPSAPELASGISTLALAIQGPAQ